MTSLQAASDFMRRQLVTLKPDADVLEGVSRLLRDNISGAPVVDEDGKYLGVFSEKCCMNALTDSVKVAGEVGLHMVNVREFMATNLVTLKPEMCVFDAIDHILSRHISGAPVTDRDGNFAGIFSEKTAMRVLTAAVYDQLPGTNVGAYMNVDRNRIIHEDDMLLDVAHKFQETPYRRLPVLRDEKLMGQVSRRDVIRAEHRLSGEVVSRSASPEASEKLREAAGAKRADQYMDVDALTAKPSTDVLGIAQMFLNSPYRRLPIVENGKLVGQVSRRDLLEATANIMRPKKVGGRAETLYLSQVSAQAPPSLS